MYVHHRNDSNQAIFVSRCENFFRARGMLSVSYEPTANADRVHHILLYGCDEPAQTEATTWTGGGTCRGSGKILFAWARNAPGLQLPADVGLAIGHEGDNVNYLVLQVHYATPFNGLSPYLILSLSLSSLFSSTGDVKDYSGVTMQVTTERPRYLAAVYIFIGGNTIPMHHPGKSIRRPSLTECDKSWYCIREIRF